MHNKITYPLLVTSQVPQFKTLRPSLHGTFSNLGSTIIKVKFIPDINMTPKVLLKQINRLLKTYKISAKVTHERYGYLALHINEKTIREINNHYVARTSEHHFTRTRERLFDLELSGAKALSSDEGLIHVNDTEAHTLPQYLTQQYIQQVKSNPNNHSGEAIVHIIPHMRVDIEYNVN